MVIFSILNGRAKNIARDNFRHIIPYATQTTILSHTLDHNA
jgi:hypothetical protein